MTPPRGAATPLVRGMLFVCAVSVAVPLWLAWTAAVAVLALLLPAIVTLLSLGAALSSVVALASAAWGGWSDALSAAAVAFSAGLLAGGLEAVRVRVAPGFGNDQRSSTPWWWWL